MAGGTGHGDSLGFSWNHPPEEGQTSGGKERSMACQDPRGHRSPGEEKRLLMWGRVIQGSGSEPVKEAVWIWEMSAPRMGWKR